MLELQVEYNKEKEQLLTRGGLFMNGRDLLFSTEREVPTRPEDVEGVKAEAEPARRAAARAANFTMFKTVY